MRLSLAPVVPANFQRCLALRVRQDQERFVRPNVYSLAQAAVYPGRMASLIMEMDEPVGFALYGRDPGGEGWIYRLMIDEDHQGRGLGRAAIALLIGTLRRELRCPEVWLFVDVENGHARDLYERLGFLPTDRTNEFGELAMRLPADVELERCC